MVGVNGSPLHGGNTIVDITRFVQRIRVDCDSDVIGFTKAQAGVNGGRSSPPILVKLEPASSRKQYVLKNTGVTGISLSRKAKVKWQVVGGLKHHFKLGRCRSARCSRSTRRRSSTTTKHGGEPRSNGILDLLRTVGLFFKN